MGWCVNVIRTGLYRFRLATGLALLLLPLQTASAEWITFATPPEAIPVFGANADTLVTQTSTNQVHCFYNVSSGGWSGAGFNWDNFSTPQNEYIDLSGSTAIVLGIGGTCTNLSLELEDIYTNKAKFYIINISPAGRTITLTTNLLATYFPNFDRSRLRFLFFVATPGDSTGDVGADHAIGNFTIYCNGGIPFKYYVPPSSTGTLTRLPGNPPILPVGGGNSDTVIDQSTDSTYRVDYNVTTGGWAGISIPFNRIICADFSQTPSIVLAVSGTPMAIKFEMEDMNGRRTTAQLYGLPGDVRYYAVDTSILASQRVDTVHVSYINLVVDKQLAGPGTQGSFRVWSPGPAVDSDGDWMPDFVERANGLDPASTNNGNGRNDDFDGDGVGNFAEIIAGTSPTNPASNPTLHIESIGSTIGLSIQGIGGRKYRFYEGDNLVTGTWTQVGSTEQPPADIALEQFVAPPPTDRPRFYRVRINRE